MSLITGRLVPPWRRADVRSELGKTINLSSFHYASMLMDEGKTSALSLLHGLSFSQKERLIRTSPFETLQSFVRKALNLSDRIWWSPGGYGELYQGKDIAVRWYSNTESITPSGKLAKEFEEKLNSMASISHDLANGKDMPSVSSSKQLLHARWLSVVPWGPFKVRYKPLPRKYMTIMQLWKA